VEKDKAAMMANIKQENWNGHSIRFVEKEPGDWWAVAIDVCAALGLKQVSRALKGLSKDGVTVSKGIVDGLGREQDYNIINELSIYRLVFKSRKEEAEEFQDWVFALLKTLRQKAELESHEALLMTSKEVQKRCMDFLNGNIPEISTKDYIKANTIANKAVSTAFGHPKMMKKAEMTTDMLVRRDEILTQTVEVMAFRQKYGVPDSVSKAVYAQLMQDER